MSTNNGTNKYKQAIGEALDALSKLVDVLSEGTASKDCPAETSESEAEQVNEEKSVLAQAFSIGTAKANDKQWIVVELKSCEKNLPVFGKQLKTYLVLFGRSVGLLINFGLPALKDGIERVVNHYEEVQR